MDLLSFEDIFTPDKFLQLKKAGLLITRENFDEYESSMKTNDSALPNPTFWKEKRILITGSAGMVGSTLVDQLIELGAEVHGTVKRHAVSHYPNIHHAIENGKLTSVEIDLRDYGAVVSVISDIEPHVIFHQAAESFVPTSLSQPSHVVENNCVSTVNLLEATTKKDNIEGIQLACSSEQYGFIRNMDELPVKETNELRPTSTYAATKVFTENIARAYHYMYKTPTVITRTFNQEGPRRGPNFFTARIATQLAKCLKNETDRIIMGNPNSIRDFTHVHDSVRAQILAVEKCKRGEPYNICSGRGIMTGEYLQLALKLTELDNQVKTYINPSFLRPYERGEALFDGFIGDNSKFVAATGWAPKKTLRDIITDGIDTSR
ncbi:GDP-mannose 4,6-dehydratase [Patescibacteria group bacterium]|nr:GDP-mannose 4,6-dehydratase [Candidatus Micrarchaeota archaeon]MBU1758372.1 GDP-mannose 4,6-dehydratase [Patescibacteria group bacterium]